MAFSAVYFSALMDIIANEGWLREAQLQRLGLSEAVLADPIYRVSLDVAAEHFDAAALQLNCPHIGVLMGYKFRVASFVETGSILTFAHSIAHAGELNARYQALTETAGRCEIVRGDEQVFLRWRPLFDDDERYKRLTEVIFAGYVTSVRWLAWVFQKDIVGLSFRHAAPSYAAQYTEILKCPVVFGAETNDLEFHAEIVDMELPTSNPKKLAAMTARLDSILSHAVSETEVIRRVKAAIRSVMQSNQVTLVNVAREMNVNERTLRRQLSLENCRFRDVVDDVRKAMFKRLSRSETPLAQIAQHLGYNDQSAFTRAFRRWYGVSPGQYEVRNIRF